jgi:hypothetical protein
MMLVGEAGSLRGLNEGCANHYKPTCLDKAQVTQVFAHRAAVSPLEDAPGINGSEVTVKLRNEEHAPRAEVVALFGHGVTERGIGRGTPGLILTSAPEGDLSLNVMNQVQDI